MSILFFLFFFASLTEAGNDNPSKYQLIIERGENYLKNQHTIQDVGSLFLKDRAYPGSVIERDIPEYDAFARLFGQKYAIKNIQINRLVNGVKDVAKILNKNSFKFSNYFYQFSPNIQKTLVHAYDDVLIKTLYCDKTGYDDLDLKILLSMRDFKGGYADTHGLLGILFLEGNQCFDNKILNNAKKDIANSINNALEKDHEYSDIYAERIACLYWAGYGEKIKPEWIKIIGDAQRQDGGWADKGQKTSSVHPTGLSMLAIRYYYTYFKRYFYDKNYK